MFDFLFNPSGRISRKGYLIGFFLPYVLLLTVPSMLVPAANGFGVYTTLLGLFFFWPALIAVPFKRFHDLGVTGWVHVGVVVLVAILTVFGSSGLIGSIIENPDIAEELNAAGKTGWEVTSATWALAAEDGQAKVIALVLGMLVQYGEMIFFLVVPGQRQPNEFGNDPLAEGRGFAD